MPKLSSVMHKYSSKLILVLCILSLFMLMVRIKVTTSFYGLFMVWNLFLAIIPLLIIRITSTFQKSTFTQMVFWLQTNSIFYRINDDKSRFRESELYFPTLKSSTTSTYAKRAIIVMFLMVWLLFLPNAPYMVTDMIHISNSQDMWLHYDIVNYGLFGWCGLVIFCNGLFEVNALIKREWDCHPLLFPVISITLIVLCSLGIYLGRELRFNSWDLLTSPYELFNDIIDTLSSLTHNIALLSQLVAYTVLLSISLIMYSNYAK